MQLAGQLESLKTDGYERLLLVRDDSGRLVSCSMVEPEEYLDPGLPSAKLRTGQRVTFELVLEFAFLKHAETVEPGGLFQAHLPSPSSVAIGRVMELIDDDTCLLELGSAQRLRVVSEIAIQVELGARVRFVGELRVHDCE